MGPLCALWMGMYMGPAIMENSLMVPEKIKNRATI